jgi:protein-disulfide isomerase
MNAMFAPARGLVVTALTLGLLGCERDATRERAGTAAAVQAAASSVPESPSNGPAPASGERTMRRVVLNGIDLTGIGYDKGSPVAPVVMVDFSDFGCPYCGKHGRETLPALEREFIATGKVFYKYVPIVMGFPNGDRAVRAAECAAEQGKFWAMHDRLYVGQQEWRKASEPKPVYESYARQLGADEPRFTACLEDGHTESRTSRATGIARALGIRATPTFAIDGQGIEGALPLDMFRQILSAKAGVVRPGGD